MITLPWKNKPPASIESISSILVVCTGNICRSPMAAGLLDHMLPQTLKERITVRSAGTHVMHGHRATEPAIQAMAEAGIDISGHRARQVTRDMLRDAGLIVTMQRMHLDYLKRMQLWGSPRAQLLGAYGPRPEEPEIEDPYGEPIETYRACLAIMRPCIVGLIAQLTTGTLRPASPASGGGE